MRRITITNLSISFDADEVTGGTDLEQAEQALSLICQTLQREPYGLGATVEGEMLDNEQVISGEDDEHE